jgi:hypothetical protein
MHFRARSVITKTLSMVVESVLQHTKKQNTRSMIYASGVCHIETARSSVTGG